MSDTFTASNGRCSFASCGNSVHARELCAGHYWQARQDRPLKALRQKRKRRDDPVESFWGRVDRSGECWVWQAARDNGYGALQWKGKVTRAHRVSFTLAHGAIPDGMFVDHVCHNRGCVNPDHLRLKMPKENSENRSGPQSNNRSGFRGVRRDRRGKRWIAYAVHFGKQHQVPGSFATAEDAASAAAILRSQLFTHSQEVPSE